MRISALWELSVVGCVGVGADSILVLFQLGENESEWITYPYFKGLISLLNDMELIKKIYLHITDKVKDKEITKGN